MRRRRGWHTVANDYYEHRKFDRVGPLGETLWNRALAYAARNRTDGFIARGRLAGLVNVEGVYLASGAAATQDDAVADLVAAGLWEQVDGGWQIHDYLDWQTSAEHQAQVSAARAEAGHRGGTAKAAAQVASPEPAAVPVQPTLLDAPTPPPGSNLLGKAASKPLPEVRSNNHLSDGGASAPPQAAPRGKKGTRVPSDFQVTDVLREWATSRVPGVDVDAQTEQFVNHYLGKGEVRADWVASWRNWMLRAPVYGRSPGRGPGGPQESPADRRAAEAREAWERQHRALLAAVGVTHDQWVANRDNDEWRDWFGQQVEAHRAQQAQQQPVPRG